MSIIHWTNYRNDSPSKIARQSSETVVPLRKRITKSKKNQDTTLSFKQLYKKHQLGQLVVKALEIQSSLYSEYDEIKIQGQIIKLNDHVQIKNGDSGVEDYIGTIEKICSITEPESQKLICLCQVKWFMKRNEILVHVPRARKWISQSEVFSTQTHDYILAQTIIQKCTIVSSDEFNNLYSSDSNTYFNRLEWDVEQKRFTNMSSVQLYCLCQQPWNPELNYIQCDKCQKWYHFGCVDLKHDYQEEEYICGYCN